MIRTLKTVGIGNLSQAENDEILSIPEPSDAAMATYIGGKKAVAERLDENTNAIHKWIADERAKKLAAEQLAEEKRQTALKEKHEQDKVDALNRQADAQERTARSLERQTQLQDVARRYYY